VPDVESPDDDAATAPPPAKLDKRKQAVAGVITLAVLVFVFVGVFPKFANYADAWTAIQAMSTLSLVLLLAVTVLNVGVYVLPYQASLPGLPYGPAFVVRQTSFMISNVIPAGGAFGLAVQYAMLSDYGYGPAATSAAIGATSTWNLMVTLTLPVVAVVLLVFTGGATANEVTGAVVGVVAVVVMVGLFALVLRSEAAARRLGGVGDRLVTWFTHRFRRGQGKDKDKAAAAADADDSVPETAVTDSLVRFRDQLYDLVRDRWHLITVTSVAQQLCQFAILLVAFYAIGGSNTGVDPTQVFAAFALARLAGFIPITPGGLGTVDAALVALLVSYGADQNVALAADLVWRAASYFPQVFIGIGTFLYWRRRSRRQRVSGGARAAPAAT